MNISRGWRIDRAISRTSQQFPEKVAIQLQGFSVTYQVLEQQSNQLATKLHANGFGEGQFIAVAANNVAEFAIGCLAVLKSGAAYIPLDLRYSHSRITDVLKQQAASLILASHRFPEQLMPPGMTVWREFDNWLTTEQSTLTADISYAEEAPACLCYTSGTTGIPKGAIIGHTGIEGLVCEPVFAPYSSEDRVAQLTTFAFDAVTLEVWGALIAGACLVEVPKSLITIPLRFEQFIKDQNITAMWLTTSYFNSVVSHRPQAFKSLKTLLIGGEAANVDVLRKLFAAGGAPERVINGYGPTEATCLTTWHSILETDAINGVIPIGRPLQGREVSIRDDQLKPVPVEAEGELTIGGPAVAKGYINNESLSAAKFVPDPMQPESRLYRTGDRAKLNTDGDFVYLGRDDNQIKVRGFRVEVSAVERALSALDGVIAAGCTDTTDGIRYQRDDWLCANR